MNADGELRVLVADDEPSMLDLMVRRLRKMGITPDQASDGAQAQALIEQNEYDVIVTDIYMPDVTGLELLHIAKERDPNVQVVVATASATIDNAVDALNNGAFGYLNKPFDHLSVFDKIVTRAMEFRRLLLDNQRMAEVQKRRGDMLEEEVTQRIRQLRDRQRDLLNLLTSLPLGVTVVEEGGRLVMSNPQAERWLAEEKLAKEHPIRAFMASIHETDSEPSLEVLISGRTIRLTAVDILHGTPKKQKVVIIGEMQHEEEGISQGTMVEEAVDRLSEGLIWLASQPLEAKANNVARGLVREIVSLGRMMGLDIDDPVFPEVESPLPLQTFVEETTKPAALPAEDEDERFLAALQASARPERTPYADAGQPRRTGLPPEQEPISQPVADVRRAYADDEPHKVERRPEPERPVIKSEKSGAAEPAAAAGRPPVGPPASREITPASVEPAAPEVELEWERPAAMEAEPSTMEEPPARRLGAPPPAEERRGPNEARQAPREEKGRPLFKSGLLRKAKELESGGWKPPAVEPPKAGANGKSREAPDEPSDNSVLSRLAQVTEDTLRPKAVRQADVSGAPRPAAKPSPKAERMPDDARPRGGTYEESDTGGSQAARGRGLWPPPLPSASEDEGEEEPSTED